ncbi:MAG TPA: hypothetical protein VGM98_24115 [Schlesneria sp.]|jgi:hypothetical protein
MRNFFNGWRRKVGCALLLVAIGFGALCVRSQLVEDNVSISTGSRSHLLTSLYDRLIWEVSDPASDQTIVWSSQPADYQWLSPWVTRGLLPKYEFAGLEYGSAEPAGADGTGFYRWVIVPYAWIILSCTLLSAYLILMKPRVIVATEAPP